MTLRRVSPGEFNSDIRRDFIRIPTVPGTPYSETTQTLSVAVYRPKTEYPRPLALFNHGSSDGMGPVFNLLFESQARLLIDHGYVVAVPMRRGRGRSDGPLAETQAEHDFTPEGLGPEVACGVADLEAVVVHLKGKSWIDATEPILVAGQSRGGFLSLAYAAKHGDQVGAVLNLAGGWWGADMPQADYQFEVMEAYGRTVTAPSLWIYGTADPYYVDTPNFIEQMHTAFGRHGARSRLVHLEGRGHEVEEEIHLWQDDFAAFLGH